jgi:hypothetical protein
MRKALRELGDDKERLTSELDKAKEKNDFVRERANAIIESIRPYLEDTDTRLRPLQTENDSTSQQRAATPDPFETQLIDTIRENAAMEAQIRAQDSLIERYEAENLSQDSLLERYEVQIRAQNFLIERYEDRIAELVHVRDIRAAQLTAAHRESTRLRRRR